MGSGTVEIDESSSYLTTFRPLLSDIDGNGLPFGICSTPEVFQRKMHELLEGLGGVVVHEEDSSSPQYAITHTVRLRYCKVWPHVSVWHYLQ